MMSVFPLLDFPINTTINPKSIAMRKQSAIECALSNLINLVFFRPGLDILIRVFNLFRFIISICSGIGYAKKYSYPKQ